MTSLDPRSLQADHADLGVEAGAPAAPGEEGRVRVPAGALRTLLERLQRSAATPAAAPRLVDLTAIDRGPGRAERLEFVYRVAAGASGPGLRIRTGLALAAPEDRPEIASIASLFPAARWLEREAAELFGIVFAGHPDPRPLLLEPGFPGWPLRKDFEDAAVIDRGTAPTASEADGS